MTVAPDFFDTESRNWRARLAVSVDVMRELSRYSDPQEMYQVFSRRMNQLFPVTRHLSITRRGLTRPEYRVTRCSSWKEHVNPWKESHRLPVHSGGLLAELLYGDQPRVIDDLNLADDDPAAQYLRGQRSILAIPHFDQGSAQNMLILGREDADAFPREHLADLVMLTNLFGRATQTLVLSQAVKEAYDAVDYEMKTIAEIQKSLLPQAEPRVPGLDVAVHYQTAKRAGGDYCDFFPLPGGKLGVLIADASGHGAPAAVLMAVAHTITHSRAEPSDRPGELLTHINAHLAKRYTRQTGSFVTAFYAVFDPSTGSVAYASAGHTPPLVRRTDGSRVALNRAQKLPLGIKPNEVYPEHSAPLQSGDQVVFLTDGVNEAVDRDGEVYGLSHIDALMAGDFETAEDLLAAILAHLTEFTQGTPVSDDRTLVVVRKT
jgi:sigma-B regulation protein RsbU (phosphoserine phosphatase)